MIRQETMNQVFLVVTDQGIVQTRDEAGDSVGFQGRSGKWGRCFTSTSFAPHLFLLGWLKLNLAVLLDQLRLV